MKAWKYTALMASFILLVLAASAQGVGGAEMTVEESLTTFVTEVLGLSVSSFSDVVLYLLAPITGFYFLVSNFAREGYNNFQKRLERRDYYQSEEDLPTGMKLFSLITSFITVVTIGRFAPALILVLGSLSLLLAVMMFLGLFSWPGDGNNNGGNQNNGGNNNNQNNQNNNNQNNNNQNNQNNNGGTLGDVLSSLFNLGETGYNIYQGWNQQASNPLQESLKYFQNDMLDESQKFFTSEYNTIRQLIQEAENEHGNNHAPLDEFRSLNHRANDLNDVLEQYNIEIGNDLGPSNSNNNLQTTFAGTNPAISERAAMIRNQFESVVDNTVVPPPHDNLRKLMNTHLDDLIAVGHFMTESPYTMAEIAADSNKAQDVVNTAKNMGILDDRPNRNEVNKMMSLCNLLETQDNPKKVIQEAITLAEKDLKIDQTDYNQLENLLKSDGEIITRIENIGNNLPNYSNPPSNLAGIQQELSDTENLVNQAMAEARKIEAEVQQNQKYESEILEKLKKIQSKI